MVSLFIITGCATGSRSIGMAKLARQAGGGLDAVLAMTGHKDLKLADHYSKCTEDDQRNVSELIMNHIRKELNNGADHRTDLSNILKFNKLKLG